MKSRLFAAYVALMLVAIGAYAVLPETPWLGEAWQTGIGLTAAAFVLVAVRRYRPAGAPAWLLIAAGVALNSAGIMVALVVDTLSGEPTYPTIADVFWLALYPCMLAGLVMIRRVRTPEGTWTTTLDSVTISTGLGLLSWVYVIHPTIHDQSLSLLGHVVVAAYPVGDIVLLAATAGLLLSGGWRVPSLRLLIAALGLFLAGDVLWALWSQIGIEIDGTGLRAMNAIFLLAFAAVGAAAVHPSMRRLAEAPGERDRHVGPGLLGALTVAALTGPAVLIVQVAGGDVVDGIAIAVTSTMLFVLVITRLAGLVRHIDAQARQLRALSRIDALTGLPNRRDWMTRLPLALEVARRRGSALCVAMIDLDHFKRFNDEFGHPAGDRLLKSAAAAWHEQTRTADTLARYGGEEFILLLPDADPAEASAIVDRLRAATPFGQTFSAGVAIWDGQETSDELIDRADRALYAAKEDGRNRTVVAPAQSAAALPPAASPVRPTAAAGAATRRGPGRPRWR